MPAHRLLALLLATTLLAGCTDQGSGTFDGVRSVGGAAPDEEGAVRVEGERGVQVQAREGALVVGLGSAVLGDVVRACAAPCPPLDVVPGSLVADAGLVSLHNASLNADGPEGDSALYFYDDGRETGRYLRWSDAQGRFVLNDDLLSIGNVTAAHHVGTITPVVLDAPGNPVVTVSTAATEGAEVTVFARGSAQLENGSAIIRFPAVFRAILGEGPLTAQATLTALGPALAVTEKSRDHIRVQSADGRPSNATFDWFVQGVRLGGEDYQP